MCRWWQLDEGFNFGRVDLGLGGGYVVEGGVFCSWWWLFSFSLMVEIFKREREREYSGEEGDGWVFLVTVMVVF